MSNLFKQIIRNFYKCNLYFENIKRIGKIPSQFYKIKGKIKFPYKNTSIGEYRKFNGTNEYGFPYSFFYYFSGNKIVHITILFILTLLLVSLDSCQKENVGIDPNAKITQLDKNKDTLPPPPPPDKNKYIVPDSITFSVTIGREQYNGFLDSSVCVAALNCNLMQTVRIDATTSPSTLWLKHLNYNIDDSNYTLKWGFDKIVGFDLFADSVFVYNDYFDDNQKVFSRLILQYPNANSYQISGRSIDFHFILDFETVITRTHGIIHGFILAKIQSPKNPNTDMRFFGDLTIHYTYLI